MLRSALLLAVAFALPSPALSDKIVNPDGDSFIEVSAVAQSDSQPLAKRQETAQATDEISYPQQRNPLNEEKPDYTAESFRAAQTPSLSEVIVDALSTLSPVSSAEAAAGTSPTLPYDIGREFDGYYVNVPGER